MITALQIEQLSRKLKTNATVAAREYLQLVFLQTFYELPGSEKVFFKGGTAIHFLMDGFRFSEDLDFTCETTAGKVDGLTALTIKNMQNQLTGLTFKKKKSIAGRTYLITLSKGLMNYPVFVRLDFSFRGKVLQKEKDVIETNFPIIFSSFVNYVGGEEILAEKTRAILTRSKGRDLFDLWFLLAKKCKINKDFIRRKMAYYPKVDFDWEKVVEKIRKYTLQEFKGDLMPFLALDKRARIDELFELVKRGIIESLRR